MMLLESKRGKARTLWVGLVARGGVDNRGDKVEEDMDSGMGTADTSEIIIVKSSATRPARG